MKDEVWRMEDGGWNEARCCLLHAVLSSLYLFTTRCLFAAVSLMTLFGEHSMLMTWQACSQVLGNMASFDTTSGTPLLYFICASR